MHKVCRLSTILFTICFLINLYVELKCCNLSKIPIHFRPYTTWVIVYQQTKTFTNRIAITMCIIFQSLKELSENLQIQLLIISDNTKHNKLFSMLCPHSDTSNDQNGRGPKNRFPCNFIVKQKTFHNEY